MKNWGESLAWASPFFLFIATREIIIFGALLIELFF